MKRTELKRKTALKQGKALKRTGRIKTKPRRRPPVDWTAVRNEVLKRDVTAITIHVRHRFGLDQLDGLMSRGRLTFYTPYGPMQWCVAPMVDPAEEGKCDGPFEMMHVQDPSSPMHGVKVPDEPRYLAMGCAWHHQGQEAGHIWATTSESLELMTNYLKEQTDGERTGDREGRDPRDD